MSDPVAFVFPGQGSQAVGMGKDLAETFAVAREVFARADEALGLSISTLCWDGPKEALTLTENTQPAILTCSVAALAVLRAEVGIEPAVCMGHSLGEYSALVAAGALTLEDAVRIVRRRGQAMQAAVPAGQGAMAAVMGLSAADVERACTDAAEGEVVAPANENGGGQIVVAGHAGAVARLCALVKSRGGRGVPLDVSAPFHCALMQPAADALAEALAGIAVHPMTVPVISNVLAEPNDDPSRVVDLLVRQVTHRVRWEASVLRATEPPPAGLGVQRIVEVGHGKVLAGLVRRIAKGVELRGFGSPADVAVLKDAP